MTAVEVSAPPTGSARRRAGMWALIAVVLVAAGVAGALLAGLGTAAQRGMLDPDSAGPDGSRALAQILREHGVAVTVARSRADLDRALGAAEDTPARATLVLPDSPLLGDETVAALAAAAQDVVVVDAQARAARVLFGSTASGFGTDAPVPPRCPVPAAQRSGAVRPGTLYAPPTDPDAAACYPVDGDAALLQRTDGAATVTAVDGTALFTNETLAHDGNAALAVNLMGAHQQLVWYVPSADDAETGLPAPTLGELTPGWVSPVIALLLAAGVLAAVWRGRRFGPLVAERLPVTVRGAETTDGRARLYARSRDLGHVADRLRAGARERVGRMLGLGPAAPAGEVCDAVADRLRMPRGDVRRVLVDDLPRTERDLLELSDRLGAIERALRRALRPDSVSPDSVSPDSVSPDTVSPDSVSPDSAAGTDSTPTTDPGRNRP